MGFTDRKGVLTDHKRRASFESRARLSSPRLDWTENSHRNKRPRQQQEELPFAFVSSIPESRSFWSESKAKAKSMTVLPPPSPLKRAVQGPHRPTTFQKTRVPTESTLQKQLEEEWTRPDRCYKMSNLNDFESYKARVDTLQARFAYTRGNYHDTDRGGIAIEDEGVAIDTDSGGIAIEDEGVVSDTYSGGIEIESKCRESEREEDKPTEKGEPLYKQMLEKVLKGFEIVGRGIGIDSGHPSFTPIDSGGIAIDVERRSERKSEREEDKLTEKGEPLYKQMLEKIEKNAIDSGCPSFTPIVPVDDERKSERESEREEDKPTEKGEPLYKQMLQKIEKDNDFKLQYLEMELALTHAKLEALQYTTAKHKEKKDENESLAEREKQALHDALAPLKDEDEADVARALKGRNRQEVLVMHKSSNIEITRQALECLMPGAWLNDEVINLYFELLKEREKREPKKFLKCHFFNTFFYKKLYNKTKYDYKAVRRWTTQKKIGYSLTDCDKIFVPIHKEIHWCLAIIDMRAKKFQYLDSLKGTDAHVLKVLARYIVDEAKDKTGEDLDVSNWEKEFVEELPAQENGSDCGVFMIKYADFHSQGLPLRFSQANMPCFRKRTAKEILELRAE